MHEVATILLAAGLSRRMGAQNKLLLPINGRAMIAHMVATYLEAMDGPILVVTGNDHEQIEAALKGRDVQTVFAPDFANGQVASVVCGLQNVAPAKAILMGLGDQPRLQPSDLKALLSAHETTDPNKISIPLDREKRGNPIVIPGALKERLLEDPRAPGCKKFTRAHPEHVQFHRLTAPGFYEDIDTPEDYEALELQEAEVSA